MASVPEAKLSIELILRQSDSRALFIVNAINLFTA